MSHPILSRAAVTLIGAALVSLSFTGVASAREGSSSKSVGHGIKCSTVAVRNADGTVTVTQVCRKGV